MANFTAWDLDVATKSNSSPPISIDAEEQDEEVYVDEWASNKWMLLLPRVTALLSLCAIVCVAAESYLDTRRRTNSSSVGVSVSGNVLVISRIQLFYQIPLFCYTLALALGPLTAPKGQVWGAIGNIATCDTQGFLLQFGLHGLVGWDSILSLTYLLMVRYKVPHLRLSEWEKYYHVIIWTVAIIMAVVPLTHHNYNFNNTICWLESYPDNCTGNDCIRGDETAVLLQNLTTLVSFLHLLFSLTMMVSLYCSIRGLEDTKIRLTTDTINHNASNDIPNARRRSINTTATTTASIQTAATSRHHSRAVGVQGMLYAAGMVISIVPTSTYILLWNAFGIWSDPFSIFATTLVPLVGTINCIVFLRTRTIEQCHTKYGKVCKTIHTYIFHFQCSFPNTTHPCFPKRRENPQNNQYQYPHPSSTANPRNQPSRTHPQSSPDRHNQNNNELKDQDHQYLNTDTASQPGPWAGRWLRIKGGVNRFNKWVSELRESQSLHSEDISEVSNEDRCYVDVPPSRPVRLSSEVFNPPKMPIRLVSENYESNVGGSSANLTTSVPSCTPEMPSCELDQSENTSNTNTNSDAHTNINTSSSTSTTPQPHVRQLAILHEYQSFPEAPPIMPRRVESNVVLDLSSSGSNRNSSDRLQVSFPWNQKRRQDEFTELDSIAGRKPPSKPERWLSEAEPIAD